MSREPERKEEEREELASEQDTMGDQENHEFNNLVNILNDLAKGQKKMMDLSQKTMMDLMGQLASHSLDESHKKETSNGEGSHSGDGIHAQTTMQNHPHLYSGS